MRAENKNAPLGRAVIGGLLFATIGTLFIVPIMYTLLRKKVPVNYDKRIDEEYKASKGNDQGQEA